MHAHIGKAQWGRHVGHIGDDRDLQRDKFGQADLNLGGCRNFQNDALGAATRDRPQQGHEGILFKQFCQVKAGAKGCGPHQWQFCLEGGADGRGKAIWRLHYNIQRHPRTAQLACVILAGKFILGSAHPVAGACANIVAPMQNAINCGEAQPSLMRYFLEGKS